MPTTIPRERLPKQSPHYSMIAVQILLGLTLTLSVAAGLAYAEIALGDSQRFNAVALINQ